MKNISLSYPKLTSDWLLFQQLTIAYQYKFIYSYSENQINILIIHINSMVLKKNFINIDIYFHEEKLLVFKYFINNEKSKTIMSINKPFFIWKFLKTN